MLCWGIHNHRNSNHFLLILEAQHLRFNPPKIPSITTPRLLRGEQNYWAAPHDQKSAQKTAGRHFAFSCKYLCPIKKQTNKQKPKKNYCPSRGIRFSSACCNPASHSWPLRTHWGLGMGDPGRSHSLAPSGESVSSHSLQYLWTFLFPPRFWHAQVAQTTFTGTDLPAPRWSPSWTGGSRFPASSSPLLCSWPGSTVHCLYQQAVKKHLVEVMFLWDEVPELFLRPSIQRHCALPEVC